MESSKIRNESSNISYFQELCFSTLEIVNTKKKSLKEKEVQYWQIDSTLFSSSYEH